MPYRPEAELKRPDLKGEFLCGHCGKTFCHAASLNRHRLNFHGDDQQCLVCDTKIPHNDTIRRHMQKEHNIQRVFTCGCCNWTFPDKKELHSHNNSMLKTGTPGTAKIIAVSSRRPGSLSQHELRGEERSPRIKKRPSSKAMKTSDTPLTGHDQILALLSNLMSAQQQQQQAPVATPTIPASWIDQLLAATPALLPFMPSSSTFSASSSSSEMEQTPEPSSLDTVLTSMMNNNEEAASTSGEIKEEEEEEEEVDIDIGDEKDLLVRAVGADFLSVKTEQPISNSMSSESGIGSAPVSNTPSPVATSPERKEENMDVGRVKKEKKSKRSIDDICFKLVCQKSYEH